MAIEGGEGGERVARVRGLYGGMIEMAVPEGMDDISRFRQVPDHQECFCEPSTDTSILVEVVEYEEDAHAKGEREAAKFHFRDLARTGSTGPLQPRPTPASSAKP